MKERVVLLLNRIGRLGRLRGLIVTPLLLLLASAGPGALRAEPAKVAVILPSPMSNIGQYLFCQTDEDQRYWLRSAYIGLPCRDGMAFAGFGAALFLAEQVVALPSGGVLAVYALGGSSVLSGDGLSFLPPGGLGARYILAARLPNRGQARPIQSKVLAFSMTSDEIRLVGAAVNGGLIWPDEVPSAADLAAALGVAPASVSTVPPRILQVSCSDAASPICEIQPGPENATGHTTGGP
ncbi:MAG: hypothetical protein AAGC92_11320 [Pseudomonadota bacterium]